MCATPYAASTGDEVTGTNMSAIHHCFEHKSATIPDREIPMRMIVGAIVMGPMNRIKKPTTPNRPMRTSNRAATVRQPCNWHKQTKLR